MQTEADLSPPEDKTNFDKRNLINDENKDENLYLNTVAQKGRKLILQN